MGKNLEKIINVRLRKFLNKYDVLTACQYGFRNKKKSTVEATLELSEQVVENFEDNLDSVCTLLDHTKTFDTIYHKFLV